MWLGRLFLTWVGTRQTKTGRRSGWLEVAYLRKLRHLTCQFTGRRLANALVVLMPLTGSVLERHHGWNTPGDTCATDTAPSDSAISAMVISQPMKSSKAARIRSM